MTTNDETDITLDRREGSDGSVARVSLDKCAKRRESANRRRCSRDGNSRYFLTPCSRKSFTRSPHRSPLTPCPTSRNRLHAYMRHMHCHKYNTQRIGAGYQEPQGAGRAARCSTSIGCKSTRTHERRQGSKPGDQKKRKLNVCFRPQVGGQTITSHPYPVRHTSCSTMSLLAPAPEHTSCRRSPSLT